MKLSLILQHEGGEHMKKLYEKPNVEYIDFVMCDDLTADDIIDASLGNGGEFDF